MGFVRSIKSTFMRVLDYDTRSTRLEYCYFIVFFVLAGSLVTVVEAFLLPSENGVVHIELYISGDNGPVSQIYSWLMLFMFVPLSVRRLHDLGQSGWFALVLLVPYANLIAIMFGVGMRGEFAPNRFGGNPNEKLEFNIVEPKQ